MTSPKIRGWCPGARRPMASGDGLVVRVRPPMAKLSAAQAFGIADLAEEYGNGLIELTNRSNLQFRGVRENTHGTLLLALAELGLLDDDVDQEIRRNIVIDPFWDQWGDLATAEIYRHLATDLASDDLRALPAKFGFVIDVGPNRTLSGTSGDIRIEASGEDLIVRADGARFGKVVKDGKAAASLALSMARWFLASGGVGSDGRGRMGRHIANGMALPNSLAGKHMPNLPATRAGPGKTERGVLIGAAFGQLASTDLRHLAKASPHGIRITPWRMVLLPGVGKEASFADQPNLITNATDPLLRVHACVGAPGCSQASLETRTFARMLASQLKESEILHVSGCAKGCAHQGPVDIALVGRNGGFDLVRNGGPSDAPDLSGLDRQTIERILGQ